MPCFTASGLNQHQNGFMHEPLLSLVRTIPLSFSSYHFLLFSVTIASLTGLFISFWNDSMQESFWQKFYQNPFSSYWDIVNFMFLLFLVTADGGHLGMPNCKKSKWHLERIVLPQSWINFNQGLLRYCLFHVYAILSNAPLAANLDSPFPEPVQLKDHFDPTWPKYGHIFSRYWHLSKIRVENTM